MNSQAIINLPLIIPDNTKINIKKHDEDSIWIDSRLGMIQLKAIPQQQLLFQAKSYNFDDSEVLVCKPIEIHRNVYKSQGLLLDIHSHGEEVNLVQELKEQILNKKSPVERYLTPPMIMRPFNFKISSYITQDIKRSLFNQHKIIPKQKRTVQILRLAFNDPVPEKGMVTPKNEMETVIIWELFQKRPVWIRNSLMWVLMHEHNITKSAFVKKILSTMTYFCIDGPWKHSYVLLGYDLKKEPNAVIYQTMDVYTFDVFNDTMQKHYLNPEELYDPTLSITPMNFRCRYQLCDIKNQKIKMLLARAINEKVPPTKKYGYMKPHMFRLMQRHIRAQMKINQQS